MSFSVETKNTTQLKDVDYKLITNTQTSDLLCGRKGDPFQGLKLGSCLPRGIVQGDTCADKARDFIGKGHKGREK